MSEFSELKGKTLTEVSVSTDQTKVLFMCDDGVHYSMYHPQSCCEDVYLDDINGDLSDLLDTPILVADVATNEDDGPNPGGNESWTWTFYRLATAKGWVVLRWYGSSNGCYSEQADFKKLS